VIDVERNGRIAVIRLNFPPVNALDAEVLAALTARLDEVDHSNAEAVVLTGAGSSFSAGANLFRVLDEGEEYVRSSVPKLARAFGALFTFPRPVVAAVNGHAIAGGAVLTCACDWKIAAAGDLKIGFGELRVGVPFPTWALEIARFSVRPVSLQEVIYFGRTYSPDDAMNRGLIDEIVPPDRLLDRAFEVAERLASMPKVTFEQTKRALRRPTVEWVRKHNARDDRIVRDAWMSDEVRGAIRAFLDKTFGKSTRR
jgi:enoyl-CoA hydratase/carnithine racemase